WAACYLVRRPWRSVMGVATGIAVTAKFLRRMLRRTTVRGKKPSTTNRAIIRTGVSIRGIITALQHLIITNATELFAGPPGARLSGQLPGLPDGIIIITGMYIFRIIMPSTMPADMATFTAMLTDGFSLRPC